HDPGLTADALRGACGTGRDITADSIASLTIGSQTPVVVHRMQAGHLGFEASHAFNVIALPDRTRFLVDPTFAQFADPVGGRPFPAARRLSDPAGAAGARDLPRDGCAVRTPAVAHQYAAGRGATAAEAPGAAQSRMTGGASV